jgi:hypothetical protein
MVKPVGEQAHGQWAEAQADQVDDEELIAAVVARICGGTIDWAVQ